MSCEDPKSSFYAPTIRLAARWRKLSSKSTPETASRFIAPVLSPQTHDLRHTYGTVLLMDHYSPAYVQKQLGHHSISMTVDIYGHWFPGEGKKDLARTLRGEKNRPPAGALQAVK